MRRIPALILVVVACAVFAPAVPAARAADPLGLVVAPQGDAGYSPDDEDAVVLAAAEGIIQRNFELVLKSWAEAHDGWDCLRVRQGSDEGSVPERLRVSFRVAKVGAEPDVRFQVAVRITLAGAKEGEAPRYLRTNSISRDETLALRDRWPQEIATLARRQLDALLERMLMEGVEPCAATIKLKVKGTLEKGATVTSHNYTGDLKLRLRADGSFETRGALSGTIASTHFGCPLSLPVPELSLAASGGFRGADGVLVFERFEVSHQPLTIAADGCGLPGGGTLTCRIQDNGTATGTCDVVVPGAAVTADCCEESFTLFGATASTWSGETMRVPLEDSASLTLPRPDRSNRTLTAWEATLDLGYGAPNAAVAVAATGAVQ